MGVNQSARSKHHIKENEEVNFDHFQILRAIGKGSFGKVCIVQKKDTGQMYAMKYMSKPACIERYALKNVLREIEILTQLDHPFLVNLWFSFHDEEDMFLVQDLLLGGDLRYHLSQNVQFPIEAVRLYVAEIALALDYLQAKNIIHRDIKPDNILLDEEGHAHITDFNVATLLEENQLATSLSGTKPYMAPEVFACAVDTTEGHGYNTSADWWSLGVVAYELSCGRRPFEIHSQLTNREIQTILRVPPDTPRSWTKDFGTLVTELLQPNPKDRLQTLDALKELALMKSVDWDAVLEKTVTPWFVPPKGHLNCDPTFELEEMIVESKPLHKKKKRLAKQRSLREFQSSSTEQMEPTLDPLAEEFTTFNRQRELDRVEREKKEQEWEEELVKAMEASGLPSTSTSTREFRLSDSQLAPECSNLESPSEPRPPVAHPSIPERSIPKLKKLGFNGNVEILDKSSPGFKKSAWAKTRALTMPEGAKLWTKPPSKP